jgi:DNA-binding HxlR family transcriptional regulator/CheY-like chemotaxis protein
MKASQLATEYNCPVQVTLEVIGGKWKCVILWWLRRNAKRFGELKLLIPGMTQKVLTQQLRELERDGLIRRETYPETPPRVEYSLTAYGETVRPITELMCDWGKIHKPEYNFGYLRLKGLQILVVAAEVEVRDRLRTVLEERNVHVIAVASPHAALEVLLQEPPQALIVDIKASSEDSYALVRQLRNVSLKQGGEIPAIALTNNDLERSRVITEGFQVHLAKPFDPVELVATLASLTSYSQ